MRTDRHKWPVAMSLARAVVTTIKMASPAQALPLKLQAESVRNARPGLMRISSPTWPLDASSDRVFCPRAIAIGEVLPASMLSMTGTG